MKTEELYESMQQFFSKSKDWEACGKNAENFDKEASSFFTATVNEQTQEAEVFDALTFLAFDYSVYSGLSIRGGDSYKEKMLEIAKKIDFLQQIICKDNYLDKNTEGWIDDITAPDAAESLKAKIKTFDNMVHGKEIDFAYFPFALHKYIVFAEYQKKIKFHISDITIYGSYCADEEQYRDIQNRIILAHWFAFIDIQNPDKRYFYTELDLIRKRIYFCPKFYGAVFSANKSLEELLDWSNFDLLFRGNLDNWKAVAFDALLRKVFLNKMDIIQNNDKRNLEMANYCKDKDFLPPIQDDLYLSPAELFFRAKKVFKDDFDKNPSVVICLYMLLKEMSLEEIQLVFPNKKSVLQLEQEIFDLKSVPARLQKYEDIPDEIKKQNGNEFRRLFENYAEDLLDVSRQMLKEKIRKNDEAEKTFKSDLHLIKLLLFLALQDKFGIHYDYYGVDYESYADDANVRTKFYDIFQNIFQLELRNWTDDDEMTRILNFAAEKMGFQKENPFLIKDFENQDDNSADLILLFNLSRIHRESREHLINLMNYLREYQKTVLPINRLKLYDDDGEKYTADEIENNRKKLKENLKTLSEIDCGFTVKNFWQDFYPFSSNEFFERLKVNQKTEIPYVRGKTNFFMRDLVCKFVSESDREYCNSYFSIDYEKCNKKSLTTRYLYKDRNVVTHFGEYDVIASLLKPKYWKNLIKAFFDIADLIDSIFREQTVGNPNIRHEPSYFESWYFMNELKELYNELTLRLQEAAGVLILETFSMYDADGNSQMERLFSKLKDKEERIKKNLSYEPKKSGDELFLPRLRKVLNIAYAANGSNEDGYEHNTTGIDFFNRYDTEISYYLAYLVQELKKLKINRSLSMR